MVMKVKFVYLYESKWTDAWTLNWLAVKQSHIFLKFLNINFILRTSEISVRFAFLQTLMATRITLNLTTTFKVLLRWSSPSQLRSQWCASENDADDDGNDGGDDDEHGDGARYTIVAKLLLGWQGSHQEVGYKGATPYLQKLLCYLLWRGRRPSRNIVGCYLGSSGREACPYVDYSNSR
jgi:hypothetical protein